jgi:integrase
VEVEWKFLAPPKWKEKTMTSYKRFPTKFEGVFYRQGTNRRTGKNELIFYIKYSREGKAFEEKAGRESHGMTAARAKDLRILKIGGKELPRREKLAQVKAEAERKKAEAEGRYDFDRLFKEYLEGKPGLKGRATDESRYELHLKPVFGGKEPKELVPLDVERLKRSITKKERKKKSDPPELTTRPSKLEPAEDGTVRNVLELLRRIINFGVNMNLIEPLKFKIKLAQLNNVKTEDLNEEQLKTLLKALDDDQDQEAANLMRLALYTGMRRGELLRLKWDDIAFDTGFIHLREPKGGHDEIIPLNSAARAALEKQSQKWTDEKSKKRISEWVFPAVRDHKKHATEMRRSIKRIAKAAGLPKGFRPLHGLRHSFASRLASSGQVDMYTLQKLLTHKSPAMTQRYSHLRDDVLKRASELAGNLFQTGEAEESSTG